MTTLNTNSKTINLDDKDLEFVTGGEHTLSDTIDRFLFGLGCILGGNTLTVKGDQLQCHI